ncbi:hypothetical protein T484DRAFT_1850620 [Baffinella frigidus]|nr:hypothetical protein T484DRAFT_1850620 [Cryptophyta sp. CCMP2293]
MLDIAYDWFKKNVFLADIAYERFLAPEIFFAPEIYNSQYIKPLPVLIDECISGCPIDTRRGLSECYY